MKELLLKELELKTTKKSNGDLAIQQTQGREIKATVMKLVKETLTATFDVDCLMSVDGLVILAPNNEYGAIPLTLDIKVKSLDYDYQAATDEYIQKQKAKEEKEAEKKKKAATTK